MPIIKQDYVGIGPKLPLAYDKKHGPYGLIVDPKEEIKQNLEKYLQDNGVETRPLCSGNLLRQPFLQDYNMDIEWDANVEYLHKNGFFIGNNHLITDEEVLKLEELLHDF